MSLLDALMASLVLMLGTSAAGQLWCHGLLVSQDLAKREESLQRLDALMLASETLARELAAGQGSDGSCQNVIAEFLPRLQALAPTREVFVAQPESPPGTLHLRWEADGLRRERLFSATALGQCREADHGP
jgi:hypothetical protein